VKKTNEEGKKGGGRGEGEEKRKEERGVKMECTLGLRHRVKGFVAVR
jgi:hypothetical protein